jgi:hypothetical protein
MDHNAFAYVRIPTLTVEITKIMGAGDFGSGD